MKKLYSFSLYFVFILTLLNEFISITPHFYKILLCFGVCFVIFSSLCLTKGFQFWVSVICLFIGHILVFSKGISLEIWYNSITKLSSIIVLFVAIPMISFPLKYGNYLESIEDFIGKHRKKTSFLFISISLLHTMLALILDIGSIPTLQKLIGHINLPKKYLTRIYTSGYASFIVFSPYSGLVNLLLVLAATTYAAYFISAFCMLSFIVIVSALLIKFDKKLLLELNKTLPESKEKVSLNKTYELLIAVIILIFLAIIAGEILPLSNVVYAITLIIIIFSLLWGTFIKVIKFYKFELKNYNSCVLAYKSIIPFLICTGFLGAIISETNLSHQIEYLVSGLTVMPLYFVIFLLILITMICSVIGIHMMIPVVTMAMTLTPAALGLSSECFVLLLLSCWFAGMGISPFAPFTAVVSETINEKISTVTFKYNLVFSAIMLFTTPLVIILIN